MAIFSLSRHYPPGCSISYFGTIGPHDSLDTMKNLLGKAVRTFFRWEGAITQICCYRIFSVSLRTQPDAAAKLVIVGFEWRKLNGDNPDHHFDPSADWRRSEERRVGKECRSRMVMY